MKLILQQVLGTELAYREQLKTLMDEVRHIEGSGLLSQRKFNVLFGQLQTLFFMSSQICLRLQETDLSPLRVATVFRLYAPTMAAYYAKYAANWGAMSRLLKRVVCEPKFKKLLVFLAQADISPSDVQYYLELPLQRIIGYPALLQEVFKAYSSHFGTALDAIKAAADKAQVALLRNPS